MIACKIPKIMEKKKENSREVLYKKSIFHTDIMTERTKGREELQNPKKKETIQRKAFLY